jgi:hypothetical protein
MLGNSFWQNFEVIFEPAIRTIWLRDKKNRLSDLGEQVYFKALVDEDPDAIEDYIEHNPSSRVISEAIEKLIEMHLNASVADKEAITLACDRLIRHRSPKDAAEKLIGFADWLFEQKRYEDDVIAVLLEQAKACSMKSTDALMLGYEAMGRLGRYAMLKKDWTRPAFICCQHCLDSPPIPRLITGWGSITKRIVSGNEPGRDTSRRL